MAKYFAAVPASASGPVAAPVSAIVLIRDDPRVDGLHHPPPEHPPRSLV